mmetsp:Transcript_30581/g.72143  ORF Transcript_30581/g.72143 Transcript_30581/m.72143 type:complete len:532 (-) Transcript_30581:296-1891(-)
MTDDGSTSNEIPTKKQKRIAAARKKHPNGFCLLARDNDHNRKLFPDGPFGNEDVADTICPSPDNCPYYHYKEDADPKGAEDTPIHLLIASYRDRLCPRTLHNAFTRAKNPKRLTFRVIEQTKAGSDLEDDQGCWDGYCEKYNSNCQEYKDQVRIVPVDSSQSEGPTWARSKLSAMIHWDFVHRDRSDQLDFQPVNIQDFCMQTDSHMDFSDNFDVDLVEMFHLAENDYAVLSTYVTDIAENNKDPTNVPHLCQVQFTSSIRNWGTKECNVLRKPKLTNAMWGAGLSFHRCHAELNVPVDPYLDNVFDGEEGSRGIRFFTHGYDVYTPHRVLVTHDYHNHQGNPVVHTWGRNMNDNIHETEWKWMEAIKAVRDNLSTFGTLRVNLMLGFGGVPPDSREEMKLIRKSRFGIGTKRTLKQAVEFTGINFRKKRMDANKCGNLLWVPYEESPDYGLGEVLSRSYVDEEVRPFVVTPDPPRSLSHAAAMSGGDTGSESFDPAAMDYKFGAGVLLLVLALMLKFCTGKRAKDAVHKE